MKKIGIGYENYMEFIDQNLYYVDKTLLVRDVLEKGGKVTLFTRPRRFGKTLGLSMLRTFFELEYGRHAYLRDSQVLEEKDRERFTDLLLGEIRWNRQVSTLHTPEEREEVLKAECGKYAAALEILSSCLKKHHGQNVIILLDEYDVPLENAWTSGLYEEMTGFIRSFFESALKTNDALEFAVATGCLRFSRESIFTGMNNLEIISVRSDDIADAFIMSI